ncbi:unnamed protein product [Pedinophyceae sp. YPF-701]|nr:unnamed protein product [Pedinophyceae sp. YPF-701]
MEASTILGRLADRNLATNAVATIVDDFKTVLKAQCRLQGEWLQQATELSFAKDQAAKLAEELATAQDVTAQPKVQALEAQVRQHERDLITAYRDKGKLSEELLASRQELAAAQHALEGLQRDLVNERDSRKDAEVQLQEALQALEREKLVAATASGELQARQAEREAAVLECETLKAENQDLISRLVAIKEAEAERRNEEMRMHAELDRRRRELEVLEKAAAVDADNRLGAVLLTGADLSAQDSVPAHAVLRLNGHDGGCFGASFNSAGDRLATCGADRIVRTWEPQSGTQMSELRGLTMTALGVAYTADDRFILACSQDGSIRAWDVRTSRERHVLTGHNQKVVSVHPFYVDASRAVSAGADRCLKIWDLNRGFCTQTLMSHSSPQGAVADQVRSCVLRDVLMMDLLPSNTQIPAFQ